MVSSALGAPTVKMAARHDHIVDRLIAERAPRLAESPVWPAVRPLLYAILHYRKARGMADAIAPLAGRPALAHVSALLALKVESRGLERIPRTGPFVAVCNHPTGIADGVAVWDALSPLRPDLSFYANADAHRVAPGLADTLIPVDWMEDRRTRAGARLTLTRTRQFLDEGRPLVIFPAGRLARRLPGKGRAAADPAWAAGAFSVARRAAAPIVPMHLAGPWSFLFHFFDHWSGELRDITLFHELLNKRGGRFRLTIGPIVAAETLPADSNLAARTMKTHVETTLSVDPDAEYRP